MTKSPPRFAPLVLFALLQIFQQDAIKPTGNSFETYTTNFKKCEGSIGEDLKFENENVRMAFAKRMSDEYQSVLDATVAFCSDYIDTRETPRNHEKLVKRLIEVHIIGVNWANSRKYSNQKSRHRLM